MINVPHIDLLRKNHLIDFQIKWNLQNVLINVQGNNLKGIHIQGLLFSQNQKQVSCYNSNIKRNLWSQQTFGDSINNICEFQNFTSLVKANLESHSPCKYLCALALVHTLNLIILESQRHSVQIGLPEGVLEKISNGWIKNDVSQQQVCRKIF